MMREKREGDGEIKEKGRSDDVVALNGGAFVRGVVVLLAAESLQFTSVYLIASSKSTRLMHRDEKASRRPTTTQFFKASSQL